LICVRDAFARICLATVVDVEGVFPYANNRRLKLECAPCTRADVSRFSTHAGECTVTNNRFGPGSLTLLDLPAAVIGQVLAAHPAAAD